MHYVMFIGCKEVVNAKWCSGCIWYELPKTDITSVPFNYFYNGDCSHDILKALIRSSSLDILQRNPLPYIQMYCLKEVAEIVSDVCKVNFPNLDINIVSIHDKYTSHFKQCEFVGNQMQEEIAKSISYMNPEISENLYIGSGKKQISGNLVNFIS